MGNILVVCYECRQQPGLNGSADVSGARHYRAKEGIKWWHNRWSGCNLSCGRADGFSQIADFDAEYVLVGTQTVRVPIKGVRRKDN